MFFPDFFGGYVPKRWPRMESQQAFANPSQPDSVWNVSSEPFVYWKTGQLPAYVPSFAEAKPKVEVAWRVEKARQLAQAESDVTLEANILDSWGEALAAAGQPLQALAKLDAATTAEASVKAPLIRGAILKNRGRVLGQLSRPSEALSAYEEALTLARQAGFLALRREILAQVGKAIASQLRAKGATERRILRDFEAFRNRRRRR